MNKVVVSVVVLVLSLTLISAYGTYYDVDGGYNYKEKIVETKYYQSRHQTYSETTTYVRYVNDKMYSIEDYKYGYSYRSSVDYKNRYPEKKYYFKKKDYKGYREYSKDYYYEYIPHLREYRGRECYHEAPKGKLFYIKCP